MESFNYLLESVNNIVWGYFLIALLIGTGVFFTIRTRFVQFRYFKESIKSLNDKPKMSDGKRSISSFQAFSISVASRVGTGNMAGVATAVAIGGPASVFWMWAIALVGSATSFIESTLAQAYKSHDGANYIGGPAYYMQKGLNSRAMGVIFSIVTIVTFGLVFNSVQTNTIALSLKTTLGVDNIIVAIVTTILTILVIFGGVNRIAKVSSIIVPVMALAYILLSFIIVAINIEKLPSILYDIIGEAMGFKQMAAGAFGAAVMQGVRRGLFSNEAGVGSAPNAAAIADVDHPVKQGFVQMLGVFTDTIIICSCTAFIVLVSGTTIDGSIKGIELTQLAVGDAIGSNLGNYLISIMVIFFAFSSVIGNYYYGEVNIRFVTQKKQWLLIYRIAAAMMVFVGAMASLDAVWLLADLTMAVMTTLNLAAILLLSKVAFTILDDYTAQKKRGVKNPNFRPSEIKGLNNKGMEVWDE